MSEHPTPTPPTPSNAPRPQRLGEVLQEARKARGLELSDIAQSTHVRKEYLKALDEGRYEDLPEDVYAKNFLRLYGQAVGLESARLLELYQRERHGHTAAASAPAPTASAAREEAPAAPPPTPKAEATAKAPAPSVRAPRERRSALPRRPSQLGGLLSSLLLVGLLVWGALWAFNNLLFPRSPTPAAAPPSAPEASPAATDPSPAVTGTVFFSLSSDPPGAEVSLDNFVFPTPAPIVNAPVTPSESRMLRVSLEGYETFEREIDLSFDRNLSVALTPLAAASPQPEAALAGGQADTEAVAPPPVTGAQGQIVLTILAESWLEAYPGTTRGQGQPLLYRTVRAGETFTFDLPVYLHIGNGGGVRYAIGGQDRGLMGSSGEVVSRAFTAP